MMKAFLSVLVLSALSFSAVSYGATSGSGAKTVLDEGVNQFRQEKYFEAIDSFRNAIEINPYYGDAYRYLAEVYFALGEFNASLENALTALKYANNDPDALLVVANSYRELGSFDKSEDYYRQILEKFPSYVEVYRNQAELYLKMNKLPLALVTLNKADRVNKNYWKNYISFGNYYIRAGNPDRAEDFLKKAFNLKPTERQVYVALADYYRSVGKYKNAIVLLETGEQLFDNFYSGIVILADCYLVATNSAKAIEKYHWIVKTGFQKDSTFLGWTYYKIGLASESTDKNGAVRAYRQAISFSPANDFILGSFEKFVLGNFQVDAPVRKDLARIHDRKADEANKNGEIRSYLLNLKRAVTLDPFFIGARRKIVKYYEQRKEPYFAYQELKALEKIDPSSRIKDQIAGYDWKVRNGKLRLQPPESYVFKGVFLTEAGTLNLPEVLSEMTSYFSEYFDKFKFSTLDFRKKQGINTILEYLRQQEMSFFVIARVEESAETLELTLYDKTGKAIDDLTLNFRIERMNQAITSFLEWMDRLLPSVWKISPETAPNRYTITAGRENGLTNAMPVIAFRMDSASLKAAAVLKVARLEDRMAEIGWVSNIGADKTESLGGFWSTSSANWETKALTKMKRVLGY